MDFYRYLKAKDKCKRIEERIDLLRDEQTSFMPRMDGMPKGGSTPTLADYMVRLERLEKDLKIAEMNRQDAYAELTDVLDALPDNEKKLMTLRYVHDDTFPVIAKRIGYSHSWVMLHHRGAVRTVLDGRKRNTKKN